MLTEYIRRAMDRAQFAWLSEDCTYFGSIPELDGVWATGRTQEVCRTELQQSLEGWIAVSLSTHYQVPAIDGIDINVERVEATD